MPCLDFSQSRDVLETQFRTQTMAKATYAKERKEINTEVKLYNTVKTRRGLIPYPTVISNMLLPMELDTAMSPKPFLATMTLVIRSGMEVPAAKNVRPITWVTAEQEADNTIMWVHDKYTNTTSHRIKSTLKATKPRLEFQVLNRRLLPTKPLDRKIQQSIGYCQ